MVVLIYFTCFYTKIKGTSPKNTLSQNVVALATAMGYVGGSSIIDTQQTQSDDTTINRLD